MKFRTKRDYRARYVTLESKEGGELKLPEGPLNATEVVVQFNGGFLNDDGEPLAVLEFECPLTTVVPTQTFKFGKVEGYDFSTAENTTE